MKEAATEIYVWGSKSLRFEALDDYHGQLGIGYEKTSHTVPKVCSFNIQIAGVSCGEDHTAFIVKPTGQVYCMGNNSEGKLGVGH